MISEVRSIYSPDQGSGNRKLDRDLRLPAASEPSPAFLVLVQLCIDLRYGRIDGLHIRGGLPVFDPAPQVIRTVKFGGPEEACPPTLAQVLSKPQTQALLRELSRVEGGCILRLEVRDSQPCFMEVAITAAGEPAHA
jgi:hypothetical protein